MRRDNKLAFRSQRPPTSSALRPERDRSRSPKRPRRDSRTSSDLNVSGSVRYEGRGPRAETKEWTENKYRERSPNRSYDARMPAKHTQSREHRNRQADGTKTKGLSDRIHSLRRLLEKATHMPADIRQEKERELQGYVADQQRQQAKREKNAVTSRYHFVRFMERKKAERRLKQLGQSSDLVVTDTKRHSTTSGTRSAGGADDARASMNGNGDTQSTFPTDRKPLQQSYEELLHEAKVDLNYTLYAPLDQKYISLYANSPKRGSLQSHRRRDQAGRHHAPAVDDDEAGIFRNGGGQKPPLWYEVEKAMLNDTLEALRDGKTVKTDHQRGKTLTLRSAAEPANGKRFHGGEKHSGGAEEESEDDFFER